MKRLLDNGEATIIAKPTFLGKLGSPSTLSFTDHTPYLQSKLSSDHVVQQLNYIENGFHLNLTPIKQHNQTVEFNLNIKLSNIKLWKNLSDGSFPVLSKSSFDSSFIIQIGKKKLIAHIIDEKISQNSEGFSPLKDIFLIGSLFKKHTNDKYKSCVLILLEINNKALE
jgi:Type II secretory pathway, component HofQ